MDARVPMTVAISAFGLSVTVTRPGEPAVRTSAIWVPPVRRTASDEVYGAPDITTRDQERKVLAVPLSATLPDVPLGTEIVAAENELADPQTWRVDGFERIEADHVRVVLVPAA